jgi:hypothetical protein
MSQKRTSTMTVYREIQVDITGIVYSAEADVGIQSDYCDDVEAVVVTADGLPIVGLTIELTKDEMLEAQEILCDDGAP